MNNFLTIPEELMLLTIDEAGGSAPEGKSFDVVLASSLLMELALVHNIDTDLDHLIPVQNNPTGSSYLDSISELIFQADGMKSPAHWIAKSGMMMDEIKDEIIESLIKKNILKIENQKVLWFFSSRRYPVFGDQQVQEVKARIRSLVFGSELPELRDMVIVSLCHYGSLLSLIFSKDEVVRYEQRISQIARMDLIGQAISKAASELSVSTQMAKKTKALVAKKSPEEKLEVKILEMKEKYGITRDEDLPAWLRKGTDQYRQTIRFIEEVGTADVYYHHYKNQYLVRKYSTNSHLFGSGE